MRLLIVDDEKHIRDSLKKYLGLEGIDSEAAETGEAALDYLGRERFDLIILDLKLPGMSGQETLEEIRKRGINAPVIMVSAHGQIPDAVAALKTGARDYLVKPFDPAELLAKIRSILGKGQTREAPGEKPAVGGGLIGQSQIMKQLQERIAMIASTDVTVLITGESGTGKEVAAREIHARSPYSGEPFVAVNMGGIHEGLMESELFGHEKGSFTGAGTRKPGLFELAGRGTIFLDEIGEMPPALQVKLLRVLQEKKVRRLGGTLDLPIHARIISATNKEPETLVKEGSFREDLYYRLNVFRITLPPLRERKEDIPLLTDQLLSRLCQRMGRANSGMDERARELLARYSFPGNVRELENILERALIYAGGDSIGEKDLDLHREEPDLAPPETPGNPGASGDAKENGGETRGESLSLEDIEKKAILDALARCNGNRTKAADMLGLSRKTIINKLRAWGF